MFVPRYCLMCILVIECTAKKNPLRIYGGSSAREGEYPFVVRLEVLVTNHSTGAILHGHVCTASAISPTWALTAAHCVNGAKKRRVNVFIRYGRVEHSLQHNDTFSDVLMIIIHPLYTQSIEDRPRNNLKNDIGLLKTTPMKVKSFGKLSAVDFFSLYGYEAVLAGYGITTTKLPDGKILTSTTLNLQKPLQIVKVLMYKCKQNILRPVICLAPRCGKRITACQGDSGGPLIHPSGVVGVISMAERSGECLDEVKKRRTLVAGLILPISPYIEWIQSHVNV